MRGDRKEVVVKPLKPSEEMMRAKGKETDDADGETERRRSFGKGPSVEAEYAFTKAIGAYSRSAIKDGSYKGRQLGNLKEQLAARAGLEEKDRGKKMVIMIGGSQICRIADKVKEVGGDVVGVWGKHKISGELTREKIRGELINSEVVPDSFVVGGPTNSLIRHGPSNRRGFGPEKRLVLKEEARGSVLRQEFHLTEPVRLSMVERAGVVRLTEELVKVCRQEYCT